MNTVLINPNQSLASQFSSENTLYIIEDELNLGGNSITIPNGSILKFEGGMFKNGSIISDECYINAPLTKIFDNIHFSGNFVNGTVFQIEWFVSNYETHYIPNSQKDASQELTNAFNSGLKRVHFNNDRYFPISNTITINNVVDITGYKQNALTENEPESRNVVETKKVDIEPCIYSRNTCRMMEYYITGIHAEINWRLNIEGINLYYDYSHVATQSNDENTDTDECPSNEDIQPIFNITLEDTLSTLWGLSIDVNILARCANNISAQPFSGLTGVQIKAINSAITYIELSGNVNYTYYGYFITQQKIIKETWEHDRAWVTDVKLFANTRCVHGGKFEGGLPVRNYGSHEPMSHFCCENDKAYFYANSFYNYGYVWDLGLYDTELKKWKCKYISKPNESIGYQYDETQEKFSQVEIVKPTDVFYPNLLADYTKFDTDDINVEVTITSSDKTNNETSNSDESIEDSLNFYRYMFPEHLIRTDMMWYNAAFRNDVGFSNSVSTDKSYRYRTKITISGAVNSIAYQDYPSLYFSPIESQSEYSLSVTYKVGGVETQQGFLYEHKLDGSDPLGTTFYYGRYLRVNNIFDLSNNAKDCTTIIEYNQKVSGKSILNRPVFFIPNYHAYKVVRVLPSYKNAAQVRMTSFDKGEMLYSESIGQLWWSGTEWQQYDGLRASDLRSGIFDNRPQNDSIPIGTQYFCTTGAAISKDNIPIFYAGNNIWVDANGNQVIKRS